LLPLPESVVESDLSRHNERGSRLEPREEERFEVVAVTLIGKVVVARYVTLEQAEWRARALGEEAERNRRGYVQYLARPAERLAREH
jgi:hypothetical protein